MKMDAHEQVGESTGHLGKSIIYKVLCLSGRAEIGVRTSLCVCVCAYARACVTGLLFDR